MNKNNKIVIVDDDLSPLEGHISLLQAEGYIVKTEITGKDGLQTVIIEKPELVILDVVLPDTNGYKICFQIKNLPNFQSPYILLLSGKEIDIDSQVKGFEAGADDYLIKPIDRKHFLAKVNSIFRIINSEYEREKLKDLLAQSRKMEAIGTLAGGIAHDFNNILGVITGNISYALSQIDQNEELYEVLIDVQDGAKKAQNLTQQLLTFSKGGEPIKKVINLNQVIKNSSIFMSRGIISKFKFDLAQDLWSVEADSGQFNQVISNLIINSDEAMPNGGIIIIQTENIQIESNNNFQLSAGKYVKISIQDNGIGIHEKYFTKIFEPYFTTKQNGSGLGLATVYSIIKKHGGHIDVNSQIEKGTIFNIYMPVTSKIIKKSVNIQKSKNGDKGNILIMDDQKPILKMVERMLNHMGYNTEIAFEGLKAIELYRSAYEAGKPFDLVILDLTIPGGMGGAKTVSELLKIDPKVKAIVSSGYSNDPIMANYQDYGFYGVIPKPYTKDQIEEVLNRILGS